MSRHDTTKSNLILNNWARNELKTSQWVQDVETLTLKYIDNGHGYCKTPPEHMKNLVSEYFPVKEGIFTNSNDIEAFLRYSFQQLEFDANEKNLFMVEHISNPDKRVELTKIVFESLKTPKFFLGFEPTLALYTSGRTTGLVITSGYENTYITPVIDGYSLDRKCKKVPCAGKNLTQYEK